MTIEFSDNPPPSTLIPETYIVCFPYISQKDISATDPEYLKALYSANPNANYYNNHSASVTSRGKPGTYVISGGIINMFIRLYPGDTSYPNDNKTIRIKYFKDCMDKLVHDKVKNMHFQFPSNEISDYLQIVEDFNSTYRLNSTTPLLIVIHNKTESESVKLVCDEEQINEQPLYEVDFVRYTLKVKKEEPAATEDKTLGEDKEEESIMDYFPAANRWNFIRNDSKLRNIDIPLDKVIASTVYPPPEDIFNAFKYLQTDPKVVLIGQDPYHKAGQAHGLSFSVQPGISIPPSLKNVYKALINDIPGFVAPKTGCLTKWAEQGVILLNIALTVDEGKPGSHVEIWESFTDRLIELLSANCSGLVFMLWGNKAKIKRKFISAKGGHLILESQHPSPQIPNNTFDVTCKHFSQANEFLLKLHKEPISWNTF